MELRKIVRDKRGLSINDIYPVLLIIGLSGILLAIVLYILSAFGTAMPNGSAAQNATDTLIDQFVAFLPWIGIILIIVAAAIVLGVLIGSFAAKSRRGV